MAKRKKTDPDSWKPTPEINQRNARIVTEKLAELAADDAKRAQRSQDWLPFEEGQELPFGAVQRVIREIEEEDSGGRQFSERRIQRDILLNHTPGFDVLLKYVNAEFGPTVTSHAMDEINRRLCKLLDKTADEIGRLPLQEAMSILQGSGRPAHPDDELGRFIYSRYSMTAAPIKTIRALAKEAGFSKVLSTDQAALKIMDAYCDRHDMNKPRRNQRRIKPK